MVPPTLMCIDLISNAVEWQDIVVFDLVTKIASGVALCALVGSPLCTYAVTLFAPMNLIVFPLGHSSELRELAVSFTAGATKAAFWINLFPHAVHRYVSR